MYSPNIKKKSRVMKGELMIIILDNTNVYCNSMIKDDLSRYVFIKIKSKRNIEIYSISIGFMYRNINLDNRKSNSITHVDTCNILKKITIMQHSTGNFFE